MITRSIVFVCANKAELLQEELPPLKPDDVLVRLSYSTISSGTERANITGELNVSAKTVYTETHWPRRGGYSASGIVEEVGKNVTDYRPGDPVAVFRERHSQYVIVPQEHLVKLDSGMDLQDAALAYISTFPMAAIRKCRMEIGESVLVMGQGVLGQIAVLLARAAGAVPVIAADPILAKRERALALGADAALDPYNEDFQRHVCEIADRGVNVAIEVTGIGKALDQTLDCMRPMGRVALLGCTRRSDFSIDYYHKVHGPGISLIGAHTDARPQWESSQGLWTTRDDIHAALRLCQGGRISLYSLVEELHSPDDAPALYKRLVTEQSFPVVQYDWKKLCV